MFTVHSGTTIGRAADADIRLDHPAVSPHHAAFQLQNYALTITDLGSANGTTVNEQPLIAQVPVPLSSGDTIQVGSPEVQLRVEA